MLRFKKQVTKDEILNVINERGNHMGNISYKRFNGVHEWGFNLFDGHYLSYEECIDIAKKLKELNNA